MLPSIFETCIPREEILAGELSVDLFAAKLRSVVEGKAPLIYQDAASFFANTFATDGIKTLIREVFSRLTGKSSGSPVIRLETSFGGGKTHDEIALWHICREGRRIQGLERFAELSLIPDRPVQVAAIDGRDLDPENGINHSNGIMTKTLWGEIAYQIGGIPGYQLLAGSDRSGISPGTDVLERLLDDRSTVIVLDEIARYLRAAKAKQIGRSDLAEQVVAFLFTLMDLAGACNNLVFVYSLASTADTFAEETTELQELIRASARQERVLSPSTDVEVYNIVKQRLFKSVSAVAAEKAASEYLTAYRASRVNLPDGCEDVRYSQAIAESYPFHPELFNLLTKKIASIPEFQKTRGALRLLAQVVRHLWNKEYRSSENKNARIKNSVTSELLNSSANSYFCLIHPHHIPVGLDEEITNDLTSRLQRSQMRPPIGADIYNPNGREAYAHIHDEEWIAGDKPPFSSWVARTIFLHSLTQGISSGIKRVELNLSLLTPGLEVSFVDRALERLTAVAWYLDYDPITSESRFKEEPSINKIVTEEKEQVGRSEAKDDLRSRLQSIFAKKIFEPIFSAESSGDVDDVADTVALGFIDFDEAKIVNSTDSPPNIVEQIFNNTGESGKFRLYRNRLLFLVANQQEIERAIDKAREYKAIKNIIHNQTRLEDLSESQQKQLREKEGAKDLDVRVSLTNAYRHLFYPTKDEVKAPSGLMHYVLPAQDSGAVKGKNNQQDIILKALKDCEKIRPEGSKPFAPVYILQKVWSKGLDHWTTKALKDAFAKDLNLNILLDAEIALLRDTIRQGLQDGDWDLKVERASCPLVYIKSEQDARTPIPETIEFSDRFILYRRGILQPPEPRVIELNAQVMPSTETEKPVRVRWKAKGALKTSLYHNGTLIPEEFRPSDEYETTITNTTIFKVIADYGNGETAEQQTQAVISQNGNSDREKDGSVYNLSEQDARTANLFDYQSPVIELDGTVNKVFTGLIDLCGDRKVQEIESLEISVDKLLDYRKLGTAIPLLSRFPLRIDQTATIQTGDDQFVRLEYQGQMKGFQSFFHTINGLLNSPEAQAEVNLKLIIDFEPGISPQGKELNDIQQALKRNAADRINLTAKVKF
ncbi:MAG: ATP-binding protein [Pleurocapsa sp.]